MLYSVLEQHLDGAWWYHPWVGTYNTKEEADASFHRHFDDGRPYIIYEHNNPLYQKYSTYTRDFVNFELHGEIVWMKDDMIKNCKKGIGTKEKQYADRCYLLYDGECIRPDKEPCLYNLEKKKSHE